MPFHFCHEEVYALLAMIPFIGVTFTRLHVWWHSKFKCKDHND